jgi:hypothetical protein
MSPGPTSAARCARNGQWAAASSSCHGPSMGLRARWPAGQPVWGRLPATSSCIQHRGRACTAGGRLAADDSSEIHHRSWACTSCTGAGGGFQHRLERPTWGWHTGQHHRSHSRHQQQRTRRCPQASSHCKQCVQTGARPGCACGRQHTAGWQQKRGAHGLTTQQRPTSQQQRQQQKQAAA